MIKGKWEEFKAQQLNQKYSLNLWHGCLQSLRQYLRGWNLKDIGEQKRIKLSIAKSIEDIDKAVESRLLS